MNGDDEGSDPPKESIFNLETIKNLIDVGDKSENIIKNFFISYETAI